MHTIITAKNNPDLDGVASAIAYAYFLNTRAGKRSHVVAFGGQTQYDALYILKELGLSKLDRNLETIITPAIKKFILVDYSEKEGISSHIIPENVIEVINHKNAPVYDDFPYAKFRIEYVGAAATLIAEEFFFDQEIEIPQKIVDLLYCAIYSNSMNYGTRMTGFRDLRMKEWLEKKGANTELPCRMLEEKTAYTKKHFTHVLRGDDKLCLLKNGLFVDLLQVEVNDSTRFLNNKELMEQAINELHTEHDVLCILHIHDLEKQKTYLVSNYEYFLWYLSHESWCKGKYEKSYIEFGELWIRKDTIPLLETLFERVDNSFVLQDFLK